VEGAVESLRALHKKREMLTVYAPAKVNLVLEVLGKDNDYHRIRSIVQSIDLCDVLNFELDKEIRFECDEPRLRRDNLVTRTASLLGESTGCDLGARMELRKRIPWGAGLGGGSSDAAATLLALNELWGLGMARSRLARLAFELGSDVPFFIHKGTALVEGKGERVRPQPPLPSTSFVLLVPPLAKVAGKTKQMYGRLRVADFTGGESIEATLLLLREGKRPDPGVMFNVFENVALDFFPDLDKYRRILEEAGAPRAHLAGSGPCLFALFSGKEEAAEVFSRLKKQRLECYLAYSLPQSENIRMK
jgi:4-diphosphocytidyl-2-C-methyl-D-erythritol kinase